jgi:dUTP pyrophosphatase
MGLVLSRSGLSSKKELVLLNGVGLIDNDYRGEIMVAVKNLSDKDITLEKFERVAQLVITPYLHVPLNKVDELSDTERGTGGFGSSGRK